MKCRKCNRVLGFDQLVALGAVFHSERLISSYVCPRCEHREVVRPERRKRSISVDFDRRVAVM